MFHVWWLTLLFCHARLLAVRMRMEAAVSSEPSSPENSTLVASAPAATTQVERPTTPLSSQTSIALFCGAPTSPASSETLPPPNETAMVTLPLNHHDNPILVPSQLLALSVCRQVDTACLEPRPVPSRETTLSQQLQDAYDTIAWQSTLVKCLMEEELFARL